MAGLSKAKTFAESNAETLRELASIDPSTFSRQVEKFKEHQQGMYGIHVVVCVFFFCCHVGVALYHLFTMFVPPFLCTSSFLLKREKHSEVRNPT
jgi:hypothetical protein